MAHVCPVWIGYLLLCPFRGFAHNPEKILRPHVREGMTVLDVGCAMGFFSLPLARMVGPSGRVVCVDMQERMLHKLEARAAKAGLLERIRLHPCGEQSLRLEELEGAVDFALAFAMVHEVTDPMRILAEIHRTLKPGASLLVAEPILHVRRHSFEISVTLAQEAGFVLTARPSVARSHAALFGKP